MKSVQIVKRLNNTELGKAGTHDTYVLVPQDLDVSELFPEPDVVYDFIDRETGKKVPIRNTVAREKRIVGLGPYYSQKDLCAGDEVVFELRETNEQVTRIIDYVKRMNTIVIQKSSYGFDMLIPERRRLIDSNTKVGGVPLTIDFITSKKKRQDSPIETNYYDVKIGEKSILPNYGIKEYAVIEVVNDNARIDKFCAWVKAFVETEE